MKELEKMLNQLVEIWWHPFGEKQYFKCIDERTIRWSNYVYSINDLISSDSGLWKFISDKQLYEEWNREKITIDERFDIYYDEKDVEFWIMYSSIAEDKTQFILSNILLNKDNYI